MTNISIKQTTPHISIRASGKQGPKGDPATNLVQSVNGKQGVVVLNASDVNADPTGSASQALLDAKDYTDTEVSTLDSSLATKVSKDSLMFNAKDHGMIGNETADDLPAFQAIIDHVNALGGGVIYLPTGKYRLLGSPRWKSNVSLMGSGIGKSVLLPDDQGVNSDVSAISFTKEDVSEASPIENTDFSNFEIDGKYQTRVNYAVNNKGIFMQYVRHASFRDIYIHDTMATGLGIDFLDNVTIDHVKVKNCGRAWPSGGIGGAGIGIGTGGMADENSTIVNCEVEDAGHFGIFVEDQIIFNISPHYISKGIVISNNIVKNGRAYGIGIKGGENITVSGNQIYGNANQGIYVGTVDSNDVSITGNVISGSNALGLKLNGNTINYKNFIISNNIFRSNLNYHIGLEGGTLENISILNNVMSDGKAGGIINENSATAPKNLTVEGNTISDNGSFGMKLLSGSVGLRVAGNSISGGALGDGLLLNGTHANAMIRSNLIHNNARLGFNIPTGHTLLSSTIFGNDFRFNAGGNASLAGTLTNTKSDIGYKDTNGWLLVSGSDSRTTYSKVFGPYSSSTLANGYGSLTTSADMPVGISPSMVELMSLQGIQNAANSTQFLPALNLFDATATSTSYIYTLGIRNITGSNLTFSNVFVTVVFKTK